MSRAGDAPHASNMFDCIVGARGVGRLPGKANRTYRAFHWRQTEDGGADAAWPQGLS